jgi:hypothetical protein
MSGIDLRHHKEVLWAGALWCVAWIAALIGGVYWLAALIIVVGIVALGLWSTLGPQIKARLEKAGSIRQARIRGRQPPVEEAPPTPAGLVDAPPPPPTKPPPAEAPTVEIPPVEGDLLEFEYRFALVGADMQGALLAGVELTGVDMRGANLRGADLSDANLQRTDLFGADLREANLNRADLRWARLAHSNLKGASLRAANLRGANLREAEIDGADLSQANLQDALLGAQHEEARLNIDRRISEEMALAAEAQIVQARALRGAIMPNGSRYDGRFNLEGDVLEAQQQGIDLNDPAARAAFYGVAKGEAALIPPSHAHHIDAAAAGHLTGADLPSGGLQFRAVPEGAHDPVEAVWRIALLPVDESQDAIGLELRGDVVVGRGGMADIDLQPYKGAELGVSRRHAMIRPGQAALTLVDLGSTNGTYRNGVEIPPDEQHILANGDTVYFARLGFIVRIVGRPARAV